ncbi:MAG: tRNA lysidine(34) synthetase TilS [Leptolyngbyaceae cyanobacterium SM2_5_2]|nr:tRNA lysidine(34) synthetase TilS [Leptolyngbyaceae cyanobacterium SM2_5_2]
MAKPPWSAIHARVHRELRGRSRLPQGTALLAAVSGGQDSVAMLKLLVDLQPKWHWQLHVAHCNHRWRPDSADNAAFVENLCRQWGIPCEVFIAEAVSKTEADARQWRYAVLGDWARAQGYTHIATGHTATDRAETLLYNLLRGSGTDGLQALAWQRPLPLADTGISLSDVRDCEDSSNRPNITLVRPLLALTRQDTADFCQQFNLPIWLDTTNQDLSYARNRLRLEVMPYLKQHFNPNVESTLAQTAEILTAEVDWLAQMTQEIYQAAVEMDSTAQTWRLHRPTLTNVHLALQRRVMRQVLQHATTTQINFEHVEKLVSLIAAPNRTQTDPFPGGLTALVAAEWIVLRPDASLLQEHDREF